MAEAQTLPALGILASLPETVRLRLAEAGRFITLPKGAPLVTQGHPQDHLYVLLSGKLSATIHSPRSSIELGAIMPGESVGEMNVIDPAKASADVVAQIESKIWGISKEAFDRLLEADTEVGYAVMTALATLLTRRIRRNSDKMLRQAEQQRAYYEWLD